MSAENVVRSDLSELVTENHQVFAELSGRQVLITGGAGFLGYYMVQAPLMWNELNTGSPPISMIVLDNFIRGRPAWLERIQLRREVSVRQHDMRDGLPSDLPEVDYVVHAAGIASPSVYRALPIETMDANVNGLRALLAMGVERRVRHPLRGFLFFSSSEIYGDPPPDQIPTPETYRGNVSCTGPRACYDESKRYGETLCVNFARVHDLPITIARPFNNYGPGMKVTDGRVIADFARNILNDEDIVMLSDGSPTRTFCYVSDAVNGYYRVMAFGRPGEPYNVGTDTPEVSMKELAQRMISIGVEHFDYRGTLVTAVSEEADYLVDNPSRRRPDISKARAEVGYEPVVPLDDGVERALQWYASRESQGVL